MSEIKTETPDVEERLAADIKAETPDIFDDLMSEIPQKKHSPAFFTVMRGIVKQPQIYAVLAAAPVNTGSEEAEKKDEVFRLIEQTRMMLKANSQEGDL